ncbi:MAG: NADH-quinone oxidoreductase subunit M [Phycisphaerae bacterium]|nr:NADH-quinone oxidoreductase subunit M [Phycisphaerae bacterium]
MAHGLTHWILTLLIATPLAGAIAIALSRGTSDDRVRRQALGWALITLVQALAVVVLFYQGTPADASAGWKGGQFLLNQKLAWLSHSRPAGGVDLAYHVGVDGVSLWLVVLAALLGPLAVWVSFGGIRERVREYYALLLLLEAGMLGVFCARDLLLFYVFFEFTLIPLYFIIGIWGGPDRRRAAATFFVYTMTGSVLLFAGVLYLAFAASESPAVGRFTFDLNTLYAVGSGLPLATQRCLLVALAAGFAIKVPLFPLHTWLPLTYGEAPTAGTVLLAGVLSKLGTYGFLRIVLPVLPAATTESAPLIADLAIAGILYAALIAWIQTDIKRLVAYSSISHLGFLVLGLFSLKMAGLTGSLLGMVNHGLATGALFLLVGMIEERCGTRQINELGGLARRMPWLAFFLVFFTLSSIGLPGLNGFVSEFLVLLGTFASQAESDRLPGGPLGPAFAIPAALSVVLGAIYMLWLCERVLFGPAKEGPDPASGTALTKRDLCRREIAILAPVAVLCVVLGVWPKPMIQSMQAGLTTQIVAHVHDVSLPATADSSGSSENEPLLTAGDGWKPQPSFGRPGDGPGRTAPR